MTLNSGSLNNGGIFALKVKPGEKDNTLADISRRFRQFFPEAIIEVSTFDNDINLGTRGVWETVEKIFLMIAIIAVILAANGLL